MSALSFTTFTPHNPLTEMQPRRPNKRLKKKKDAVKHQPWKVGLAKEQSGNPATSTLSNDPLHNREVTLLLSPSLLLFLVFFLEELNLPPTHPCGVETHAPI
ncbi:hypothetical protein V8G54_015188 [Vigna mungo]|uniref:Uncharacterized protein n=1 Tax=Vigna mungo TaxID=3915 RepID=A0AAQ3NLX5_VIGMU